MFVLFRLIFWILFMTGGLLLVRHFKKHSKRCIYILVVSSAIVLCILSMFVPIENGFVTFASPEDVFSYYTGNNDIKLTVTGSSSDLVIGNKGGSDSLLIVPKTDTAGWRLDTGMNTQSIYQMICDDVLVQLYKHIGTNDLYLVAVSLNHQPLDIYDSLGSAFYRNIDNIDTENVKYSYYAHITDAYQDYWLSINGNRITDIICTNSIH